MKNDKYSHSRDSFSELPVINIDGGVNLFHHSRSPQELVANGFNSSYANSDYFGSFFFASERAIVSNCSIVVHEPLKLLEHGFAVAHFDNVYDASWLEQEEMGRAGFDGTYEDIDDACTELELGGWTLQIVVFADSLPKLGAVALINEY